jgi:release factor glutamine methyltransferase
MEAAFDLGSMTSVLREAGCVAPEEEARELIAAAGCHPARLRQLVARRTAGEPLAWLTGHVRFCGETIVVPAGVFVPRAHTAGLAREAVRRLPERGLAVDLCTGSGAVAAVLARRRPSARVLATDIDPFAVVASRANGVEAYVGDMSAGLPGGIIGQVDVVSAVVPYVPTDELRLLARDVLAYEPLRALDGGAQGMLLLVRAVQEAAWLLRRGGSLLLELGGDQAGLLRPHFDALGYRDVQVARDEDGDVRAVYVRR